MLIAAMNPCPCGWHGDSVKQCTCAPGAVSRYQKRISGPLLDRIDTLRDIEVPRVDHMKLTDARLGESSETIQTRVAQAREIQRKRFGNDTATNADMRPADVRAHCKLDDAGMSLVRAAMAQLQLSARAFHRILSWTLSNDCHQGE